MSYPKRPVRWTPAQFKERGRLRDRVAEVRNAQRDAPIGQPICPDCLRPASHCYHLKRRDIAAYIEGGE